MANDVHANRSAMKWTHKEIFIRLLWGFVWPIFRLSPRIFWSWRVIILRAFGARIGRNVHIYPTVRIIIPWNLEIGDETAVGDYATLYALGPIKLGPRVTVSQGSHLCAGSHDYTQSSRPLTKRPIIIEADVWIAADAFIGPGVTVEANAIVGARSVVFKNVQTNRVVAGNPARVIRILSEPTDKFVDEGGACVCR